MTTYSYLQYFKIHPLRGIIFDDYEFLYVLYGITGANGKLLSVFVYLGYRVFLQFVIG